MKQIQTEILIHARPEKVWEVFTDFEAYPEWNPFIISLTGEVAEGSKFKVRLQPPESKGMAFQPRVIVHRPGREFKWLGHLLFPGLFDGAHCFQLCDNGNGTTTFIQSETFTGILVPLFKKMLEVNTRNGFIAMNEQLKARVEADI